MLIVHYFQSESILTLDDDTDLTDTDNFKSLVVNLLISLNVLIDSSEITLVDYTGVEITSLNDFIELNNCNQHDDVQEQVFHLWGFPSSLLTSVCFSEILRLKDASSSRAILQNSCHVIDTEYELCQFCSSLVDCSIINFQRDKLDLITCCSRELRLMGLLPTTSSIDFTVESPLELYFRRQIYKEAIQSQEKSYQATSLKSQMMSKRQQFLSILQSGHKTVQIFEDITQQRDARAVINYSKIIEYSDTYMTEHGSVAKDTSFLHGLLQWFKCDHFHWTNKPSCSHPLCPSNKSNDDAEKVGQNMEAVGMVSPSQYEISQGWAERCESYMCNHCRSLTRFPRYNNPSFLLKHSPYGRCGEFANAFGLVCRSLGFDVQYVRDLTDHVWIEVWLPSLQQYVHVDCCERALDSPLMYESGWGKKLTYIISFSRFGVYESSSRYSRKFNEVIVRRQELQFGEQFVLDTIKQCDIDFEKEYLSCVGYLSKTVFPPTLSTPSPIEGTSDSDSPTHSPLSQGSACYSPDQYYESLFFGEEAFESLLTQELHVSVIKRRKRCQVLELERMKFLNSTDLKLEEMRGRISGEESWKEQRGELGTTASNRDV